MHTRATWIQVSPDQVERMTSNFEEKVIPAAKTAKGFAGAALLIDREKGLGIGVTVWESARALAESEEVGIATRTQAASDTGARIVNVERGEVVVMDRAAPARVPGFARVSITYTEPEKLDQMSALIRDRAVPKLRENKGYRSVWMTIDRTTGQGSVLSVWDSAQDREASNAAMASLREEAARLAGSPVRVELFEQVAVELLVPSPAR